MRLVALKVKATMAATDQRESRVYSQVPPPPPFGSENGQEDRELTS